MADSDNRRLREQREEIVRRHITAENSGDLDAVIASFRRPRYQVVPMGVISDGEAAVRELVAGLMRGFPDFRFEQPREVVVSPDGRRLYLSTQTAVLVLDTTRLGR